jgi:protein-S-isoprenylcysteine O-methyltransferase Ste14
MLVFMLGCLAFFASVLVQRIKGVRAKAAGGKRDLVSLLGIAVQALGIAFASGQARIVGDGWLDGLMSRRTCAVVVLLAASVALFRWAAAAMGRNWAIVASLRADHQLVVDGPFAYVRNPIYVAMGLFLVSLALATAHERALAVALPVFLLGTSIRIWREERLLRGMFGAEYDAYAARVKRLIPFIV